jgi:hypothetical protein
MAVSTRAIPRKRRTRIAAGAALAVALVAALAAALLVVHGAAAATTPANFTFAAFGDANLSGSQLPPAPFTKAMDAIKASGAAIAVCPGDFVNDLPDAANSSFSLYKGQESAHLGTIPVYRAAGDNDHLNDSARLSAWNAAFPNLPTSADAQRRWGSVDYNGVHFILLSTEVGGRNGYIGFAGEGSASNSTEGNWLVSDLKTAAATNPSTIVVLMHAPLMYGKSTGPYTTSKAAEATALKALFGKYGVDMVIAGHTHTARRDMLAVTKNGTTYQIPFLQAPAVSSQSHVSFGSATDGGIVPQLTSSDWGWQTVNGSYKGYYKIAFSAATRTLGLHLMRVNQSDGSQVEVVNGVSYGGHGLTTAFGGTFNDVPATLSGSTPTPTPTATATPTPKPTATATVKPTPTPTPSTVPPVNGSVLSAGRAVTASSTQAGNLAAYGNDGSATTRWAAGANTFPQTWTVDLGSAASVTQVKVLWYGGATRSYKYQLQTSTDGVTFTTALDRSANTVTGTTTDAVSVAARYVRVRVTGVSLCGAWASLYEVTVTGSR